MAVSENATHDPDETVGKQQAADPLKVGFEALRQVFDGFSELARKAADSHIFGNLQSAALLEQVAVCLDSVPQSSDNASLACRIGEVSYYREQLTAQLKTSAFAHQLSSFDEKLAAVAAAIQRAMHSGGQMSHEDVAAVCTAAGYFRAAAKSATVFPGAASPQH